MYTFTLCVIDKSAKSKKRDGGTPDKMSSPVGSTMHIPDELCTGPSIGKVITGDDIDCLAINVDELKKVSVKAFFNVIIYCYIQEFKMMFLLIVSCFLRLKKKSLK